MICISILIFGLMICTAYVCMQQNHELRYITLLITVSLMITNFAFQMSPCYKEEKFHPKSNPICFMVIVYFGLIFFMRLNIATEMNSRFKSKFIGLFDTS